MNPLQEYIAFIHERKVNHPHPKEVFCHVHHIWPTSLGGPDEDWNKVRLTPEEHLIAHSMLPDLYVKDDEKMAMLTAYGMMSGKFFGKEVAPEEYGRLMEEYAKRTSQRFKGIPKPLEWRKRMSGEGNGFYGKHHSEETKKILRAQHLGRKNPLCGRDMNGDKNPFYGRHHSEETRRKLHEANIGKHPSDEARARMSAAKTGSVHSEETKRKMSEARKAYWAKRKATA